MYLLDAFASERVDEPGLSTAELHHLFEDSRLELLPSRLGVLRIERGNLFLREVSEQYVLRDDVERADLPKRLAVGTYLRLVVADVKHPDKRDGRGEWNIVAVHIAVAQLAKKGYQHIACETVGFVEEHGNRPLRLSAQFLKHVAYRHRNAVVGLHLTDSVCNRGQIADHTCTSQDKMTNFPYRNVWSFHELLKGLQRAVQRDHIALRVDFARQRLERRRLARLARRVDDEIPLHADQAANLGQSVKRRQHVVLCRKARPRCVEVLFHTAHYTIFFLRICRDAFLFQNTSEKPLGNILAVRCLFTGFLFYASCQRTSP